MRSHVALTALVLVGCADSLVAGQPIQIVAQRGELEPSYGVVELWRGSCGAPEALEQRRWFSASAAPAPTPDGGVTDASTALRLRSGEDYCVRVFAVRDEPYSEALSCTVVGLGERELAIGEVTEARVVVDVRDLAEEGPLGPRAVANARFAADLCPPFGRGPMEGARLGEGAPTFRFTPYLGATPETVYCLRLEAADRAPVERQLPVSLAEDGETLSGTWPESLDASAGLVTWAVRACPDRCPDDPTPFAPEAAECTAPSTPRTFAARPEGDFNGDARPDFLLATPTYVQVFLSGPGASDAETYELCGAPYHLEELRPDPAAECGARGVVQSIGPMLGEGLALANLDDDPETEILAGAPNCRLTTPDGVRTGGALFAFDEDLAPLSSLVFEGSSHVTILEVYGLDVAVAYRGGARATDVDVLGAEFIPGAAVVRDRVRSLALDRFPTLGADVLSGNEGRSRGRGDLDGDGLGDLVYRELVRIARPPGSSSAFRNIRVPRREGGTSIFLGDRVGDGDFHDELLLVDNTVGAACESPMSIVTLDVAADGSGSLRALDTWERTLPPLARTNCVVEPPVLPPVVCTNGTCDPTDTNCVHCGTRVVVDATMATAIPLGTAWAPGAGVLSVYLTSGGVEARPLGREPIPVPTAARHSFCLGLSMEGRYDLDGDGYGELLVVDPVEQRLLVACGSEPTPHLDLVRSRALADLRVGEEGQGRCLSLDPWSFAP